MSQQSKAEYLKIMWARYRRAARAEKSLLLDELCRVCGYHRKHAIRKLNQPPSDVKPSRRRSPRTFPYEAQVIGVLKAVWEVAGFPWSVRFKALLPLWRPWILQRFSLTPTQEAQLLRISPRQLDRRLQMHKRKLKKRLYGRTKPGTLLKHQIPIRTEHWDVTEPGSVEIDLVPHSGSRADGTFIYSLNLTDIYTGWVETRAVMGKGERGIVAALNEMRAYLPFPLRAIDSDNGSEFINDHLWRYCRRNQIQFTRGRPYQKDDNAHIEQKNWTHVRKLMGWERYDHGRALAAMNEFYRRAWPTMMNLFQPSVKLLHKKRVGSRLCRQYDAAQTPLDRLIQSSQGKRVQVNTLRELRQRTDPFELAATIECQLRHIWECANHTQRLRVRQKHG